jgi:hypothetical protein
MSNFSNVLRLINAVSGFSDNSLGMTIKQLEEYFHKVFKDEKTYGEFYHQGVLEMNEEVFNYTKMCCDVDGFSEDAEDYIFEKIIEICNPFLSVTDNYNNLNVEIFHDASGYRGQSLTDAEFEDFRGYVDEKVALWKQIDVMVKKKLGEPFENNADIINDYCQHYANCIDSSIFYRHKTEIFEKMQNTLPKTEIKGTQMFDIHIGRDVTDLVYAILNTSNYDGDMGAIVVKGISPIILKDYGFDDDDCKAISTLAVGASYTSTDYGNGVVVVRMS